MRVFNYTINLSLGGFIVKKLFLFFVFCLGIGVFFLFSEKSWVNPATNLDKPMDRTLFSMLNINKSQGKIDTDKTIRRNSNHPQTQPTKSDRITARHDEAVEDHLPGMEQAEIESAMGDSGATVELWKPRVRENSEPEYDESVEYEEKIQTDSEALASLQVGQVVEFFVPQLGESFLSEIDSTSNQWGDVKVWKGKIQDGEDKSNFIMTQGATMTHVVLATSKGVYTAYIDNETSEGTIVDDREYTGRLADVDDSVPFQHNSNSE